jgi:hypothetical protein
MMRKPAVVLVLVLALIASLPTAGLGCYLCKTSPDGWGFCRAGFWKGYGNCSPKVVDQFSGRTSCDTWEVCYNGGTTADGSDGDYWDDPSSYAERGPCSWTDTASIRLV